MKHLVALARFGAFLSGVLAIFYVPWIHNYFVHHNWITLSVIGLVSGIAAGILGCQVRNVFLSITILGSPFFTILYTYLLNGKTGIYVVAILFFYGVVWVHFVVSPFVEEEK